MTADQYLIWFIVAAALANIVIYGGIVSGFFWDLHRGDGSKSRDSLYRKPGVTPLSEREREARGHRREVREERDAA